AGRKKFGSLPRRMSILAFTLQGDIAFWRDFEDSVGNLTCLGPAPSHIFGIIAACFGWSSTNRPHNQKGQAPWPYAAELKTWVETNKPKVAARLLSMPVRIPLSVNGLLRSGLPPSAMTSARPPNHGRLEPAPIFIM